MFIAESGMPSKLYITPPFWNCPAVPLVPLVPAVPLVLLLPEVPEVADNTSVIMYKMSGSGGESRL